MLTRLAKCLPNLYMKLWLYFARFNIVASRPNSCIKKRTQITIEIWMQTRTKAEIVRTYRMSIWLQLLVQILITNPNTYIFNFCG